MTDARHLSARSIAGSVQSGDLSARDVLAACLDRLHCVEPRIHAYLRLDPQAVQHAETVDRKRRRGHPLGPLAGVPVAIKDNICIADQPLSCGSNILQGFVSPYSATAVQRLLQADAILVGATNLDAFGMGASGEMSDLQTTHNPWHLDRVPGGSSGGSAAAVAAGSVPLALGSDTGGSVRQPASFCGIVGLRPTYGRVSRHGLTAFASSMDQIGPLARCVDDVALALDVMGDVDPWDATTRRWASRRPPISGDAAEPLAGMRCGVMVELEHMELEPACRDVFTAAVRRLKAMGAQIVEVSVPNLLASLACYYVIAACEASTNLARFDGIRYGRRANRQRVFDVYSGSRSEGLGREVRRRIMLGTFALSSGGYTNYYARAQGVRRALRQQMLKALDTVDLLLTPTTPGGAFRLGEHGDDPLTMVRSDRLTTPASLAGLPALTVPCGSDDDGMPLGLQVMGRPFDETTVVCLGKALENAIEWRVEPRFVESTAD